MNGLARPRRADSFFGLHFDFHAGPDCTEVGRRLDAASIDAVIDAAAPDYIQVDCKGHPGYASYPTAVGTPAPGFVRDPLALWREVTARRGVALFVHYSGVWDEQWSARRPDAAAVTADGTPSRKAVSLYGSYADELLVPQLLEVASRYGVDGAWVDGDSWAVEQDWSDAAREAFRARTGRDMLPRAAGEPGWVDFTEIAREAFRRYLRRYVDALHARAPGFQVASNWAFSSLMPEPVSAGVDFLSGDYSLADSVRSARFEARCMRGQGLPWDLMAWSFSGRLADAAFSTKSAVQLKQEAAVVLSLGGGFQLYVPQKRDASIARWQAPVLAEVAQFCRARRAACHRARPVPQVGLLYAGSVMYRESPVPFANWELPCMKAMKGVLHALLDGRAVVDVCMEHHLEHGMGGYPLLVVPEWSGLDEGFRQRLVRHARAGAGLLVIGAAASAAFSDELGVATRPGISGPAPRWLSHAGTLAGMVTRWAPARVTGSETRLVATHHPENDPAAPGAGPGEPAAVVAPCGQGRIAAVLLDIGAQYLQGTTPCVRGLLASLVAELLPEPLVRVRGPGAVDITAARSGGALRVNVVNTGGPHADPGVYVFDEVAPAGPLGVEVRVPVRPARVTVEPGGRVPPWSWSEGRLSVELGHVVLHDIISIREEG